MTHYNLLPEDGLWFDNQELKDACGRVSKGYGNNPDGAVWRNLDGSVEYPTFKEEDRCCDGCNRLYVIPGRLHRISKK